MLHLPLLRFVMSFFGPQVRFLFGVRSDGAENIPKEGRVILACNHVHAFDPVWIGATQHRLFQSMAKAELFKNKISAFFLTRLGAFPINRGHSDLRGLALAKRVLTDDNMLLIYPEGTRSKTGQMGQMHKGVVVLADKAKAPIVPAFITETTKLRLFGKIFVRYGKPVTMDELTEGWTEESGIERLQYAVEALKVKILELENKDYR